MPSICKEIDVAAPPAAVWGAIRDVGAAHTRLFPGILTGVVLDGDARIVTFANGLVVREAIIELDDSAMRFAYSASGGRATHHNASLQVFANGTGSRVVWIIDFLPNEIAEAIDGLMSAGCAAMKTNLER